MENHTVKSYDLELTALRNNIIEMIMLVRDMIFIADRSLQESNESFVEIAYATDQKINKLDTIIEAKAISIIALRQPMAIDLRESIAALRIAVILERMGDLSKNISNRIDRVSVNIDNDTLDLIHKIAQINIFMIDGIIKAYKNADVKLAKEVYDKDNEVDKIYKSLMSLLEQKILETPTKAKSIMQVIFALKNLERIGDYTTKLATLVNYIITGERIISNE